MRGTDLKQEGMFSYVSPEARVPTNHPLRPIRAMVSEALEQMDRKLERLYSQTGRPSIAPERLIRALLLQVLYSIRSERMLVEQLEYNLLFRWFVGLSVDEPVWDHSTFSKNRDRLFGADIARELFDAIVGQARTAGLLSDEHFSVDGTIMRRRCYTRVSNPRMVPADLRRRVDAMRCGTSTWSGALHRGYNLVCMRNLEGKPVTTGILRTTFGSAELSGNAVFSIGGCVQPNLMVKKLYRLRSFSSVC